MIKLNVLILSFIRSHQTNKVTRSAEYDSLEASDGPCGAPVVPPLELNGNPLDRSTAYGSTSWTSDF